MKDYINLESNLEAELQKANEAWNKLITKFPQASDIGDMKCDNNVFSRDFFDGKKKRRFVALQDGLTHEFLAVVW